MSNKEPNPVLSRTYQIPSDAVDVFEDYISALKKYARKHNLPPVDRSVVVTEIFKGLKPLIKNPAAYFQTK